MWILHVYLHYEQSPRTTSKGRAAPKSQLLRPQILTFYLFYTNVGFQEGKNPNVVSCDNILEVVIPITNKSAYTINNFNGDHLDPGPHPM